MKVLTNQQVRHTYKRVVANKARVYGDTDLDKKVIRIRKKPFKTKKWNKDEVLDTIVHEVHHAKHPKKTEKTVRKDTKSIKKHLTKKAKKHYYSMFVAQDNSQ